MLINVGVRAREPNPHIFEAMHDIDAVPKPGGLRFGFDLASRDASPTWATIPG